MARPVAALPRGAVLRPQVALLAAVDDPVAAALESTGGRAAVAGRVVAVVALLAGLDEPVAADGDGVTRRERAVQAHLRRRRDRARHDRRARRVEVLEDIDAAGDDRAGDRHEAACLEEVGRLLARRGDLRPRGDTERAGRERDRAKAAVGMELRGRAHLEHLPGELHRAAAVGWMSPPPQVPPLASICCTLRLPAAERNTSPPQLSVPTPAALIAALTTTSPLVPSMSGEPPLPAGPETAFTGASTRVEPLAITVMSAPSPPWPVCPPPGPLRGPFSVMSCCAVIRTVPPLPLVPPPGTSISPSVTLPWLLSTSTSPPSKSPPVASSTPETLTAPTASRQIMPPAPWLPLLASSCPVIPIVLPAVTMMQPPSPSDVLACATTSPAIETAPPALSVMSPAPASPDTSIRPFAVPEICTAMSPLVLTVMSPPYPPVAERARS